MFQWLSGAESFHNNGFSFCSVDTVDIWNAVYFFVQCFSAYVQHLPH